MNKLVVGNLIHRPLRSLISVLAVAIEVLMILSIAAVMLGMLNGSKTRTSGIGLDMFVRPSSTNNFAALSSAATSVKVADVLAGLPHIAVASPVNIQLTVGSSLENIYGIDFKSFDAGHRPRPPDRDRSPLSSRQADPSPDPTTRLWTMSSLPRAKATS